MAARTDIVVVSPDRALSEGSTVRQLQSVAEFHEARAYQLCPPEGVKANPKHTKTIRRHWHLDHARMIRGAIDEVLSKKGGRDDG